jgi:hypothetical protein
MISSITAPRRFIPTLSVSRSGARIGAYNEAMSNPWLSILLEDYEGHMGSPGVQQLTVPAELFKCALDYRLQESVSVLAVAGGNGLEQIDNAATKRIVGVDINERYLNEVQRRFGSGRLAGLELYCRDLAERNLRIPPVALVHVALNPLNKWDPALRWRIALSLVVPGGHLSVVLQLPSEEEQGVPSTSYTSTQALKQEFALIDIMEFQHLLAPKGFRLAQREFSASLRGLCPIFTWSVLHPARSGGPTMATTIRSCSSPNRYLC